MRLPGVYPPQPDTWLLADVLQARGNVAARRVLDVCAGTGALAIAAALSGAASVTAVDLSARAAMTTWLHSRLQGHAVRVRRGHIAHGQRHDELVVIEARSTAGVRSDGEAL